MVGLLTNTVLLVERSFHTAGSAASHSRWSAGRLFTAAKANPTSLSSTFRSFCTSHRALTNVLFCRKQFCQQHFFQQQRFAGTDKRLSKSFKQLKLRDLKRIAVLALPYKWRIGAGIVFLLSGTGLLICLPKILGKMMDDLDETKKGKNEEEPDIFTRAARFFKQNRLALAAVVLLGVLAAIGRIYCMHTASQLIVNDMRTRVFRAIIQQDMDFFDRSKVGELISRLSADAYVVGYSISSNLGDGMRAMFGFSLSSVMMFYSSKELTMQSLFLIPTMLGIFFLVGRFQMRISSQMQDAVAVTNQLATERLSNVRTIRAFVAEDKELGTYKQRIKAIWGVSRREGIAGALFGGSMQMVTYGFLTYITFYGSDLISQGLLSYGDLSAFMMYALLATYNVSALQSVYANLMKGLGASERLFELRDARPKFPLTGGIVLNDLKKEIRFESVAFSYPDRDVLFNDVTFRIPVASTTAIVGPSGCGKSTIAHLLLRLYNPTMGRIMVDEHDMRDLDPSAWRSLIGTVSQEPVLFSATIRENILYGVKQGQTVTDEELHEVAELSNCLDFIQTFPDGFDTMVGEHSASMLSGGQRQRIAIARALIKKPRILILDEATSALDATSEYLLRRALENLLAKSGQTVVIIAHRLSTIKHANQIVVIDKGTVAELDNFDNLMGIRDGIFRQLVEKQTFYWRDDKF